MCSRPGGEVPGGTRSRREAAAPVASAEPPSERGRARAEGCGAWGEPGRRGLGLALTWGEDGAAATERG